MAAAQAAKVGAEDAATEVNATDTAAKIHAGDTATEVHAEDTDAMVSGGDTAAEVRAKGMYAAADAAGERPVVLTVARLAQQKGLDTLLTAAAGPFGGVRPLFVIAGEGPWRAGLQARIDAEGLPVVLLGDRGDVGDLLRVARALVVPSLWEGQPLSVQEALRAGTPVIATAVGGVPGMVGDAGLLVPPGDAAGLRREIARVLADPVLAERLSVAAAARDLPDEQDALSAVRAAYGTLPGGDTS
jgi:glycosyltransferase involved in cell wall biosynthesis